MPDDLFKKSLVRAATTPLNLTAGAFALAASAATWNPLPLILWGIGSVAWTMRAATSERYAQHVAQEAYEERQARAAHDQRQLKAWLTRALRRNPFSTWVRQRAFPDYEALFAELEQIRDRVAQIAHERQDVAFAAESGIHRQIDALLSACFQFVRARIMFVEILTGVRSAPGAVEPAVASKPRGFRRFFFVAEEHEGDGEGESEPYHDDDGNEPVTFDLERMIRSLESRLRALQESAGEGIRDVRESHAQIVTQRLALLREILARDERVAAQLDAMPDVFAFVLDRVSAAQFNAGEITSYMSGIVTQVEETQRFVEEVRPTMERALDDAMFATLTA